MRFKMLYAALAAMPVVMFAFSTGPPPMRTGAAVDGGINCTACHGRDASFVNVDPRGSEAITFDSPSYAPGAAQTVHVRVFHPEQVRWGFQITARTAGDLTRTAGVFTPTADIRVVCANGREAPCDGALEFATHRLAPRTGVGAGFTFDVQWTPPAGISGDIVFYAAGNAADGNGAPGAADRIYTTTAKLSAPCTVTARPTLREVTDAASFRTSWAPNSLVTLFGTGFAASGSTRAAQEFDVAAAAGLFPKELGCVAVEFGGGRVPVTYVSANQINAQAPTTGQAGGTMSIAVILNPGRANEVRSETQVNAGLRVLAPSLFTFDGASAAAQIGGTSTPAADPSVAAGGRPARPGELVTFYATGLGYTNPSGRPARFPRGLRLCRARPPYPSAALRWAPPM